MALNAVKILKKLFKKSKVFRLQKLNEFEEAEFVFHFRKKLLTISF